MKGLILLALLVANVANAQDCQPEGAALECPGHGSIIRCEVPLDAQAVSDRYIFLRLYINGRFVDYPATQQFPLSDKVYQDWPFQPTDDIYWGTCINHLLVNPCTTDENGDVQPTDCKHEAISEPMELGYSYGVPLPEPSGIVAGIAQVFLVGVIFALGYMSGRNRV